MFGEDVIEVAVSSVACQRAAPSLTTVERLEAALGATVKTPTPAGPVDLRIPPNSNSGKRLRLKGRGMPGKTPGDLYVVLAITLPPIDNGDAGDEARAVYERMAEAMPFNPRARLGV